MACSRPEHREAAGFTLLEVMFAVAILGLVTSMMAGVAMQGLATEGDARRRLEASLLADRTLSDIELELASGNAPRLGSVESEEDLFRIVLNVEALDLEKLGLDLSPPERPGRTSRSTGERGVPELFRTPRGGSAPVLVVQVQVLWTEGIHERDVTRTSFALDRAAAEDLLGSLSATDADEDGDEDQGGEASENQPRSTDRGTRRDLEDESS